MIECTCTSVVTEIRFANFKMGTGKRYGKFNRYEMQRGVERMGHF